MTLSPTRTKTSDAKLCQLQCHGEIGEILNHEGKQGCIANRGISEFPEGSVSRANYDQPLNGDHQGRSQIDQGK
jgi:hypothetical protein